MDLVISGHDDETAHGALGGDQKRQHVLPAIERQGEVPDTMLAVVNLARDDAGALEQLGDDNHQLPLVVLNAFTQGP
jgi:hypothetical protein